ncbi:hypothetical protein KAR91_66460 [Candidatus Pacearchaeota archaeon]|nr:hypothetical protein [Candidatus Pacearchaeota archaeon]
MDGKKKTNLGGSEEDVKGEVSTSDNVAKDDQGAYFAWWLTRWGTLEIL